MGMGRLARRTAVVLMLAVSAAGGAAAANVLTDGSPAGELTLGGPAVVPGSNSLESTAPDPAGGPGWAVRVYTGAGGETCADFGRQVDGKIGLIDGNGDFHERRLEEASGNCGVPDQGMGLLISATFYPDDPTTKASEPPRTILHGVLGARVQDVSVQWPDGERRLDGSRRGAILSVYDGPAEIVPVTVHYRDGSSARYDLKLRVK
jgi:hypothetical protein